MRDHGAGGRAGWGVDGHSEQRPWSHSCIEIPFSGSFMFSRIWDPLVNCAMYLIFQNNPQKIFGTKKYYSAYMDMKCMIYVRGSSLVLPS